MIPMSLESSMKMGAPASFSAPFTTFGHADLTWPLRRSSLETFACEARKRCASSLSDISSEKSATGTPCSTAAFSAMLVARLDLPIAGRAASTIRLPGWKPPVRPSRWSKPERTPVRATPLSDSSCSLSSSSWRTSSMDLTVRSIEDVLHDELDKLHELSERGVALTGVRSGFDHLDGLTGGFQPGNLIVLAARPAMGKSSLATNIAENAAVEHGVPVALFSLEMSESELAHRFLASQAKVSSDDLRKGQVKSAWPKVVKGAEKLAGAPIFIDDSSDIGIIEIRAKARRLHARGQLQLLIVDYLQLLRPDDPSDSRVEQVGKMSRGLKILARELDIPVIAISQLSRAVESRHPPIPVLSDLRESGNVEQDSDLVMFVYRDEYYNEDTERPGEADLIISKHRNGPVGRVPLAFQPRYPRFTGLYREPSRGAVGAAAEGA